MCDVILLHISDHVESMMTHEVVPIPLKGRKTYIDPLVYASPNEAVEEFAKEIEPKLLELVSEIGAGNDSKFV